MNDDPYFSSIGDFVDNSPAYKLICTSMRELLPNKRIGLDLFFAYALGRCWRISLDVRRIRLH